MARRKDKGTAAGKLSNEELSAEFFGDGSKAAVPGQADAAGDTGTGLASAIGATVAEQARGRVSGSRGGSAGSEAPAAGSVPGESAAKGTRDAGGDVYKLYDDKRQASDFGPDYGKRPWLQLGGGDNPEVNPYAAEQNKRYALDPRALKTVRLCVLLVIAFVLCTLVLPSATYNLNFGYSFQAFMTCVQDNVASFVNMLGRRPAATMPYKLCTYGIVAFAGAGLAITGAVYQGALKNALVSPTTLGVNAGGTLGVALFVVLAPVALLSPISGEEVMSVIDVQGMIDYYDSLSLPEYLLVTEGRAFASIVGCFVAVGLVMLVSHLLGRGRSSSYALIVCGMVVASVASSVVEVVRYYLTQTDPDGVRSTLVQSAQIGAISSVSTPLDLLLTAVPVLLGVAVVVGLRRRLNLLSFSDEEARSMGIATERLRWAMVLVCTFITAVVISFCGNVAFVGYLVPLIVRRYVGPEFNYLVPASAVMGALFMVCVYWFTDLNPLALLGIQFGMSVSMITSLVGAVVFIVVTLRQRGEARSADWL